MSKPPPKYSNTELESVLSESGPMPAAKIGIRLQAFFFDWVFVSIFLSMVIGFVLPRFFPDAFIESRIWFEEFFNWIRQNGFSKGTPMPEWSESFATVMVFTQLLTFFAYWVYFVIGEAFFSGHTFGKSICRLRTVSIVTMKKPSFMSVIARSGLKALALLYPLLLLATVIVLQFNRRRQMGHDLLCRTAVVDEKYISSVDQM